MRVVIIGASGLVGGHCLQAWQELPGWVVAGTHYTYPTDGTYYFDALLEDPERNFDLQAFKPEWVVHCGALTHVDQCQQQPELSYRETVESTRALLRRINCTQTRVAYLSSDYVFDGSAGPYAETDATHPLSTYGHHKLAAEKLVLEANPMNLVVRVTNVYGEEPRSKNFIERLIQTFRTESLVQLRLPTDQYATPIYAGDIAQALNWLLQDEQKGIWHLAGTDFLSRYQLAQRVAGHFPDTKAWIQGLPTQALNPPAPRPLKGGLYNRKFQVEYPQMHWTTVEGYLRKRLLR